MEALWGSFLDFLPGSFQPVFPPRDQRHIRTFTRKRTRRGPANPGGPSCDDNNLLHSF